MDGHCNPTFGFAQPRFGIEGELLLGRMPKGPVPDCVRDVQVALTLNLRANIFAAYKEIPNPTNRAAALARDSGVSKNTILRILDDKDETSPSIDKLAKIADALGLSVTDLLNDHGKKKSKTRPKAPSVVRSATEPLKGVLQRSERPSPTPLRRRDNINQS